MLDIANLLQKSKSQSFNKRKPANYAGFFDSTVNNNLTTGASGFFVPFKSAKQYGQSFGSIDFGINSLHLGQL